MSDKLGINNITKPVYEEFMKEMSNKTTVIDVSNIQSMSDSVIDKLKVGDVVAKKTGNQKHCYIVTYKEEKHGICLSYFDGSGYIETISYDYTNGHWVYNSKDVFSADNIKGFNGDIKISYGPNSYIKASNLPSSAGMYRLISSSSDTVVGFIIYDKHPVDNTYNAYGIYFGNFFSAYNLSTSNNFNIASSQYKATGSKLYKHNVKIATSRIIEFLSLVATPVVNLDTIVSMNMKKLPGTLFQFSGTLIGKIDSDDYSTGGTSTIKIGATLSFYNIYDAQSAYQTQIVEEVTDTVTPL